MILAHANSIWAHLIMQKKRIFAAAKKQHTLETQLRDYIWSSTLFREIHLRSCFWFLLLYTVLPIAASEYVCTFLKHIIILVRSMLMLYAKGIRIKCIYLRKHAFVRIKSAQP